LLHYARETRLSDCQIYAFVQSLVLRRLGVRSRFVAVSTGYHGWLEAFIYGNWEIADGTSNTWVNRSALELVNGVERSYRSLYTPWADSERADARTSIIGVNEPIYHTPGSLRMLMPGIGLYFLTGEDLIEHGAKLDVVTEVSEHEPKSSVDLAQDFGLHGRSFATVASLSA